MSQMTQIAFVAYPGFTALDMIGPYEVLRNLPGAEVVWTPTINQGLVRFPSPKPGAAAVDHDARSDEVIARIVESGEAFFGGTTWRGARCMGVSVCNWQTSDADVERAVAAVERVLASRVS